MSPFLAVFPEPNGRSIYFLMLSHTISFSLSLNFHYLRIFNKDSNANRLYTHSIRACEKWKGLQRSFNLLALQIFSHYQDRRQMIRQDLGRVFTSYLTITMPHSSVFLIMLLGAILFYFIVASVVSDCGAP